MIAARALIVGGLAAGALLSLAAPAATVLWHALGDTAIAARELPPLPPGQNAEPVDTSALRAFAPFGSEASAPDDDGPPGETSLDLALHGVAISSDPSRSAAFIETGDRTRRYLTGEAIAEGVTLTAVAADHVRLDVDGAEEILSFPNALSPAEPRAEEGVPAEVATAPMDRLGAAIVDGVRREREERAPPETVEDHIALWRDRIRRNPSQVLDRIGLVPGEGGYTIAADHDGGVARIGLRSGDVVTRVNGQAVGNVGRDRALYDEIAASGLATVEIERDGETITMSFPLR